MTISQRLRTCARHTGLDAVIELLTEAADEIDALQARAQATQAEVTDGIRPEDFTVDVVVKPMGGFAPVNTQGVRVTHKPTGISVTCEAARSQHTNRRQAFETLRTILTLHPERGEMMEWQPIETAPKDGPFLAVLDCGGDQTICTMRHAVAESKNSRPDGDFIRERVTHWMPLPALPESPCNDITTKDKKETP